MRHALRAAAASLALAQAAAASPAPSPSPSTPAPTVSPSPDAPRKRLRLEPWVDPYGKIPMPGVDMPRYTERVEVPGKAMDSRSLTLRMAWFMGKEWEPLRGAVPRGSSAPMLEETYPFRPRPTQAPDIGALIQWLAGKLKKD